MHLYSAYEKSNSGEISDQLDSDSEMNFSTPRRGSPRWHQLRRIFVDQKTAHKTNKFNLKTNFHFTTCLTPAVANRPAYAIINDKFLAKGIYMKNYPIILTSMLLGICFITQSNSQAMMGRATRLFASLSARRMAVAGTTAVGTATAAATQEWTPPTPIQLPEANIKTLTFDNLNVEASFLDMRYQYENADGRDKYWLCFERAVPFRRSIITSSDKETTQRNGYQTLIGEKPEGAYRNSWFSWLRPADHSSDYRVDIYTKDKKTVVHVPVEGHNKCDFSKFRHHILSNAEVLRAQCGAGVVEITSYDPENTTVSFDAERNGEKISIAKMLLRQREDNTSTN